MPVAIAVESATGYNCEARGREDSGPSRAIGPGGLEGDL